MKNRIKLIVVDDTLGEESAEFEVTNESYFDIRAICRRHREIK